MREPSLWDRRIAADPNHSQWYIDRFRAMAADGVDLDGEARFVDAMVPRGARILDAGCGPGRVGGRLHELGHDVVGVDGDRALIAAAEADHPGPRWIVGDLADLDDAMIGGPGGFDLVLCAGNVMTFLAPGTRRTVLERLRAQVRPDGRAAIGFGTDREYPAAEFRADAAAAGFAEDLLLATWDLRPYADEAAFLVAVLRPA